MGKKSNCWLVSLVLQNRLHRSKLFSSTLLDFVQLDLHIFCNIRHPSHQSLSSLPPSSSSGLPFIEHKTQNLTARNDRNPLQVKIIWMQGSWSTLSPSSDSFLGLCWSRALLYSVIPYPHFLGPQALLLFSFLFPSILPSDFFSSFSRVSFLTLDTFIYIVTPTTIVCPQLLHQSPLSFGLYISSHPPAISIG